MTDDALRASHERLCKALAGLLPWLDAKAVEDYATAQQAESEAYAAIEAARKVEER